MGCGHSGLTKSHEEGHLVSPVGGGGENIKKDTFELQSSRSGASPPPSTAGLMSRAEALLSVTDLDPPPANQQQQLELEIAEDGDHEAAAARDPPSLAESGTQTEPVTDEAAFDWDLSDRADSETQTSVRPAAPNNRLLVDAIVQTDQRLAFLLRRSAPATAAAARIRLHDAWCQTYIEVQEIGVQVTPSEFDSTDESSSRITTPERSRMKQQHNGGHNHHQSRAGRSRRGRGRRHKHGSVISALVHASASGRQEPAPFNPVTLSGKRRTVNVGGFFPDGGQHQQPHNASEVTNVFSDPPSGMTTDVDEDSMSAGTMSSLSAGFESVLAAVRSARDTAKSSLVPRARADAAPAPDQPRDRTPATCAEQSMSYNNASFQVNTSQDGTAVVARSRPRDDVSSPVGLPPAATLEPERAKEAVPKQLQQHHASGKSAKSLKEPKSRVEKVDKAIQTDATAKDDANDSYAVVLPPTTLKFEFIGDDSAEMFEIIDNIVMEEIGRGKLYKRLSKVVQHLLRALPSKRAWRGRDQLVKARAIFKWVTESIHYDSTCLHRDMSVSDILRERRGVCVQYAKIFAEMCALAKIKARYVKGFAKGPGYVPGTEFDPSSPGLSQNTQHAWNAVFLHGSWRLVDCTWGAGRCDADGNFIKELNEHFFLTDPEEFKFSHFPYHEVEENYSRWQLLEYPISLSMFNEIPRLTSMFFEYQLVLSAQTPTPIVAQGETEIKMRALEVVRYKYKFYMANEMESDAYNNFVFFYLKGRSRLVATFHIAPPKEGNFLLKIYAKPEDEIIDETDTLDHIATFLIKALEPNIPPLPWPLCPTAWGLTESFIDTEAQLPSMPVPAIEMVGEKTKKVILKTPKHPLISTCHIYDASGNELVRDQDREMKYTVLLNKHRQARQAALKRQKMLEKHAALDHSNRTDSTSGSHDDSVQNGASTTSTARGNGAAGDGAEDQQQQQQQQQASCSKKDDDDSSLLPFIKKKETEKETVFLIEHPPNPGKYRLEIFGRKRPKKRGILKLPLIATILVDYRHGGKELRELDYAKMGSISRSLSLSHSLSSGSRKASSESKLAGRGSSASSVKSTTSSNAEVVDVSGGSKKKSRSEGGTPVNTGRPVDPKRDSISSPSEIDTSNLRSMVKSSNPQSRIEAKAKWRELKSLQMSNRSPVKGGSRKDSFNSTGRKVTLKPSGSVPTDLHKIANELRNAAKESRKQRNEKANKDASSDTHSELSQAPPPTKPRLKDIIQKRASSLARLRSATNRVGVAAAPSSSSPPPPQSRAGGVAASSRVSTAKAGSIHSTSPVKVTNRMLKEAEAELNISE